MLFSVGNSAKLISINITTYFAYLINMQKTPILSKKINMHAYINKHAQNCTKNAKNVPFTNGTPYLLPKKKRTCFPIENRVA